MKTLRLAVIGILLFALASQFNVSGQEVNTSPQEPQFTAKMDKINYENTDHPLILISGTPNSTLNLVVLDPSDQEKLSDTIRIGPNGTARYSLDITSYHYGVYHALVGSGYDRINLGFAVGLKTTGTIIRLNVPTFAYKPGEIIEAQGSFNADSKIQVDLINPHGVSENSMKVMSDHFGNYLARLEVPHDAVNGVWKISATGGMANRILDITVISNYTQQAKITNANTISPPIHTLILGHPLKQLKSGTAAKDITCKDGFQLVVKAEDGSPACVHMDIIPKLFARGWASYSHFVLSLYETFDENGTITIGKHQYYYTIVNDTMTTYRGEGVQATFHNVVFTFLPSPYYGGSIGGCGGFEFKSSTKFSDDVLEFLRVDVPEVRCLKNYSELDLTQHTYPQAGLAVYDDGKIRLLVSTESQSKVS